MNFLSFQNRLAIYPVFSLQDVRKAFEDFSYRQLDRWEKMGYLRKVKRGFYCFLPQPPDQNFLFYTANKIYSPSYVSLEMALKYYGFIPEEIFQVTSVATRKTVQFETPVGSFAYRHLKPSLFWGYRLVDFGKQMILIADPEKAILDSLYLRTNLKTVDDFLGMRINTDEFRRHIDGEKLQRYLKAFGNKQLEKRVRTFLMSLENDNS